MPRLLLTRPADDAETLVVRLREMGVDSLVAPLLEIEYFNGPPLDVDGVQGFLLTSANGVRALARRTERRDIPCYAVGDATARQAAEQGFESVQSADGDVDDLARLVGEECTSEAGALLHAAGTVSAGDLAALLAPVGFNVRRERLYEARTVDRLAKTAQDAIEHGDLDGVVLYSPRTARHFVKLVAEAGLSAALGGLTLFALSENVDQAAAGTWAERIVAAHPDQESLLDAVRTCYY
ncbi:uroporphyrinogen-III synthase [Thalassospiraceae bacterium LMO-JJ14]|nr:uroporphyrinogen-III synthase [Thalassospiraceae bacterium LMO-JJ14]